MCIKKCFYCYSSFLHILINGYFCEKISNITNEQNYK